MNWKVVAVCGGIAFILSFLSGLLGGVSILSLLVRAGIGAVLFAGVAASLMYLLERFIPELYSVMFGGEEPATHTGITDEGIDIIVPADEVPEGLYRQDEEDEDEELALEVGELTSDESMAPPPMAQDSGDAEASEIFDGMDSLPDLDSFSGSFSSTDFVEKEPQPSKPATGSPVQADSYDPETIARAVQTLLKKDREGKGNYGR